MANENFGLGFTVEPLAIWVDDQEGVIGESATIFIPFGIDTPAHGEFGTIFVPFTPGGPGQGEAGTVMFPYSSVPNSLGEAGVPSTSGLCPAFNVLQGPGQSVLSSDGGFSTNILSCP